MIFTYITRENCTVFLWRDNRIYDTYLTINEKFLRNLYKNIHFDFFFLLLGLNRKMNIYFVDYIFTIITHLLKQHT